MAEGLLRAAAGDRFDVYSAGTRPSVVRPEAIDAMAERGIDITSHRSKHVDEFTGQEFDYVMTVCDDAREACPVFPAATRRLHWSLPDPAAVQGDRGARLDAFRRVRDSLDAILRDFAQSH
jgi:arsenate reductase